MRAYYAHAMATHGSDQEARDIALIDNLGFECVNPSAPEHSRTQRGLRTMSEFCDLAASCDCLIFRAFPDGRIGAGVAKEIATMRKMGKPVLELFPHPQLKHRMLSRAETRLRMRPTDVNRNGPTPMDPEPLNVTLFSLRESDEYADQDWGNS